MDIPFSTLAFVCCQGGTTDCYCTSTESALRRYASHPTSLRPMTADEREWCVGEADRCAEGGYKKTELEAMSDSDLARAVLTAWHQYVQSHF